MESVEKELNQKLNDAIDGYCEDYKSFSEIPTTAYLKLESSRNIHQQVEDFIKAKILAEEKRHVCEQNIKYEKEITKEEFIKVENNLIEISLLTEAVK